MSQLPNCPKCNSEFSYEDGEMLVCPDCAHEWNANAPATVTAEEVQITGSSFTAVANRYYRITYYEPNLLSTSSTAFALRIRQTNLAGTVLNTFGVVNANVFLGHGGLCIAVSTFTAGSVNVVGTLQNVAGTGTATRSATQYAFLLVEDIGPS